MFRFIIEKMRHKKWMMMSLLIGCVLMIGIASANPMYVNGALQNQLVTNFISQTEQKSESPMRLSTTKQMYYKGNNWQEITTDMKAKLDATIQKFELPVLTDSVLYRLESDGFYSSLNTKEKNSNVTMEICYMEHMEDHIEIISGRLNTGKVENGSFECIVSESAFQRLNLVLGETITFEYLENKDKSPLKATIVGVFQEKEGDEFWENSPATYNMQGFISEEICNLFMNAPGATSGNTILMPMERSITLDYSKLKYEKVNQVLEAIELATQENISNNFEDVLKNYQISKNKVEVTMNILQMPTLFLLMIFIYMVSSQMFSMEFNEIAMLKSRGVSRKQTVSIYFIQSVLLATIAYGIGIPLGYGICRILGVSNSFMEFVGRKALPISITQKSLAYGGIALLFAVLVMTIPAIRASKTTIVGHKQGKDNQRPIWKKFYLDVILFGISIYGCYNFTQQKSIIIQKVMNGEPLDPFLFLCSSLFILSVGMFAVRMIPNLVWAIYMIGKKHWKVATYTAFLQTIRSKNKQDFIMIFLVLTIALGIFNANIARTINVNEEYRIKGNNGADLVLQENWENNKAQVLYAQAKKNDPVEMSYKEPDFYKYDGVKQNIESITKVYSEKTVKVRPKEDTSINLENVLFLGINTKEFGETAWMQDGLLDKHWYYYLNAMAIQSDGVLVSKNLQKELSLKLGDVISYTRYDELESPGGIGTGIVCGFIDYFPSYNKKITTLNEDGTITEKDQYLVVANYDQVTSNFNQIPYQIWIKNVSDSSYIYDFAKTNGIKYSTFKDSENDIIKMKNDPVFQETNGMLTISFLIIVVLCGVGFLIYWILSIQSRELLFGIYRAMGMSMKEILRMLIYEHLFSSVTAMITGACVGILASYLFIPLIAIAYSSGFNQVKVVSWPSDMIRLGGVVALILIVCIIILGKILSKMKISQALKLGEE